MLVFPSVDWMSWAGRLNQLSLLPFLAFMWTLSRIPDAPQKMVRGWYVYFLFIAVAIPAGIYSKTHLGTSMANVDWIHGPCELLLTLANLFIVLGLRDALRTASAANQTQPAASAATAAEHEQHKQQQQQQDPLSDMQYMQQLHSLYSSKLAGEASPLATADMPNDVITDVTLPDDISRGIRDTRGRDPAVPHAVVVRKAVPALNGMTCSNVSGLRRRALPVMRGRPLAAVAAG